MKKLIIAIFLMTTFNLFSQDVVTDFYIEQPEEQYKDTLNVDVLYFVDDNGTSKIDNTPVQPKKVYISNEEIKTCNEYRDCTSSYIESVEIKPSGYPKTFTKIFYPYNNLYTIEVTYFKNKPVTVLERWREGANLMMMNGARSIELSNHIINNPNTNKKQ